MTTQEFMNCLAEIRPQFVWKLVPDAGPYARLRKWPRLHLRAIAKIAPHAGVMFEPMGALCYARTGRVFEPEEWAKAGDLLGLLPVRASELNAASHDQTWAGAEGKREPVEYLQALRARMMAAVGVSATSPPIPALKK